LHNRTTEKAHVLIPAATFAEADGTLVNNEGRAQHFYQVFMPVNTHIKESWRWLGEMKTMQAKAANGLQQHPDEWLAKLEVTLPQFANIAKVMPSHHFRINGQAIPREPHRYSGRTAMQANLAVSEPKPLQDDDSPLTYTMEGYTGIPPSSMIPYFWAPGWNSGQAVNKYQQEMGGALRKEDPGICLFANKKEGASPFFKDSPEAFIPRPGKHLLLPQYQLFGSGELSIHSKAISELVPAATIVLSKKDAADLGAANGTLITIEKNDFQYRLPLIIHDELCNGIVLASAGYQGMPAPPWGSWVKLSV
jgi:NADH-quinone oxidoreductase subunit G